MAEVDWDDSTNDDVGLVGEAQFELWCAQAQIVPNRVSRDRRGSDFVIEFNGPSSAWRLEQVTSKVQVKTSAVDAASVSIKLDNFIRMASDLHPWFVVALSLDEDNVVRNAHVIHVDEPLVRRVYRRVVEVPPGDPLHKRTLALSWSDDERLPEPSARAMSQRIKSHIGPSMWDYVSRKHQWHETLEISRYVNGTCLIAAKSKREAMELLVDLAIGVLDRVPIESVRVAGLTPKELSDGEGFFSVEDRPSLFTTVVTVEAHGMIATLRCKTFHSKQAFPDLPDELQKFRFESTLLSIVASDGSNRLNWHLAPPAGRYRLAELGATGNAVALLAQSDVRITFDLAGTRVSVGAAAGTHPPAWAFEASRFAAACSNAAWLAGHFGLDLDMEIDPRLLVTQADRLMVLRGVLDPCSAIPELKVLRVDAIKAINERGALVVCPGALFEDVIAIACVGLIGPLEHDMETATIVIREPRVRLLARRCMRRDEWKADIGLRIIADGVTTLESEGLAIITIDPPLPPDHGRSGS